MIKGTQYTYQHRASIDSLFDQSPARITITADSTLQPIQPAPIPSNHLSTKSSSCISSQSQNASPNPTPRPRHGDSPLLAHRAHAQRRLPSASPTNPALSAVGKVVIIVGAGGRIGYVRVPHPPAFLRLSFSWSRSWGLLAWAETCDFRGFEAAVLRTHLRRKPPSPGPAPPQPASCWSDGLLLALREPVRH
jgi:hypothetical protein